EALVQAAVRAGASRFVLVSSLAAAGPATTGSPLAGHEPPQPVTRYGRSKLAAERVVIGAPIDWTIVRPPAVYGPGDREMFRIFRAASRGLGPVFGDGSQQLSLVYGPDLAEAIAAIGPAPVAGRIFHAAHPEILTTRRIVELAGAAVGKRVRIIGVPAWIGRGALRITDAAARLANRATVLSADKAHEFFAPAWLADPAPLAEAVGWTAAHDFATGARAAVDWYRRRGWL
ncbi:MAG: NAD-dependent epimerase/dehydratase family protein, partial [Gemmatimonadales bacterium]